MYGLYAGRIDYRTRFRLMLDLVRRMAKSVRKRLFLAIFIRDD